METGAKLSKNSWHYKIQQFVFGKKVPTFSSLCPYFWTTMLCLFLMWFVAIYKIPWLIIKHIFIGIVKVMDKHWIESRFLKWFDKLEDWEKGVITNIHSEYWCKYMFIPVRFEFDFLPHKSNLVTMLQKVKEKETGLDFSTSEGWNKNFQEWHKIRDEWVSAFEAKKDADYVKEHKRREEREARAEERAAKYAKFNAWADRVGNKVGAGITKAFEKLDKVTGDIKIPSALGALMISESNKSRAIHSKSTPTEPEKEKKPKVPIKNQKWFKFSLKAIRYIFGGILALIGTVILFFIIGYSARFLIWCWEIISWPAVLHYTLITLAVIAVAGLVVLIVWGIVKYVIYEIEKYKQTYEAGWYYYVFVLPFYYCLIIPIEFIAVKVIWKCLLYPICLFIEYLIWKPIVYLAISFWNGFRKTFGLFFEFTKASYKDVCPMIEWEEEKEK